MIITKIINRNSCSTTVFKSFISVCLFSFLSFSFLRAQERTAIEGFKAKAYFFNGGLYELYRIKHLEPYKVDVSSTLKSDTGKYEKRNLFDFNVLTAWGEGVPGNGVGETIRLSFKRDRGVHPDVMSIIPGNLNSGPTWYSNNRVSKFKIRFLAVTDEVKTVKELTVSIPKNSKGLITPNIYNINLGDLFVQNIAIDDFEIIEIEILEVDAINTKYNDTCISEIGFYSRFGEPIKSLTDAQYHKMVEQK